MGKITINFADVESSFEAIPAGPYQVVVEKVEVRESKSSDHNYLNWELTLTEGEHEGRKQWMITSLSPKALFRLKDVFVNLGVIEGDEEIDIDWDDDVEITPQAGPMLLTPDVIGLAATAIIIEDEYQGRPTNRVDDLRSPEGEVDRPASSSKSSGAKKSSGASATKRRALR